MSLDNCGRRARRSGSGATSPAATERRIDRALLVAVRRFAGGHGDPRGAGSRAGRGDRAMTRGPLMVILEDGGTPVSVDVWRERLFEQANNAAMEVLDEIGTARDDPQRAAMRLKNAEN